MKRRVMMGEKKESEDINTLLLLHAEDFKDSSIYNRAITNSGSSISTIGKFDKCFYFSGSSHIQFEKILSGVTDFTVELFVKTSGQINAEEIIVRFGGVAFRDYPSASISMEGNKIKYQCYMGNSSNGFVVTGNKSISDNSWHHIAMIKNGTKCMGFIDGVLDMSKQISFTNIGTPSTLSYVGNCESENGRPNNFHFHGYIDELRISDIARWTTNFTPPTKPY